jgi:16S rRNA A1518/A1519 N6-dimethyltransferase RsmA/KsgA/DIM1 with predicted DNA glycosylase/AP lyase activity
MNPERMDNSPSPGAGNWFDSESEFHLLFPPSFHSLARNHWTPLLVAQKAANFLAAEDGVKVLDIGSGIGKFCLAAAYYKPKAFFYGIEQRKDLVEYAEAARQTVGLHNVSFMHRNIMETDFENYDHFYFYNSFYENLATAEKIDNDIPYSIGLYNQYTRFLYKQFQKRPSGTRIVTYHGMDDAIPSGYLEGGNDINNLLKYWIKE